MKPRHFFRTATLLLAVGLTAVVGCRKPSGSGGTKSAPKVTVAPPTVKDVTDYEDFSGRTDADLVEVKARATGYLLRTYFHPGQIVQQGEPLYLIDPELYQAKTGIAEAQQYAAKVRYIRLSNDVARGSGGLTVQEWEKLQGDHKEAEAALKGSEANLRSARLNESYTIVRAGATGRISRNLVPVGNLVTADATVLTQIVSEGQMFAYFDVDENHMLEYQQLIDQGKIKAEKKPEKVLGELRLPAAGAGVSGNLIEVHTEMIVELRLGDGQIFPRKGKVDFSEIRIDRNTGTRTLRGLFPDPDQKLLAGQFITVRVPIGEAHRAVLIPESAIGSDQGTKYVYIVDGEKKVQRRNITPGDLHEGLIEIRDGLKGDEQLIVNGMQRVRPGMTVDPQTLNQNAGQ
jgi:RND family efflux transporter MFP subunit